LVELHLLFKTFFIKN